MSNPTEPSAPGLSFTEQSPTMPQDQTYAQRRRGRGSSSASESSRAQRPVTRRRASTRTAAVGPADGLARAGSSSRQSNTPPGEGPDVQYTRTGRISKAKKGLKVHQCECGKTYTRAEHLRRHQQNHNTPDLDCDWPGCGRKFHREDLLARHKERHNEEDESARRRALVNSSSGAFDSHLTILPTAITAYSPSIPGTPDLSTGMSVQGSEVSAQSPPKHRSNQFNNILMRQSLPVTSQNDHSPELFSEPWCQPSSGYPSPPDYSDLPYMSEPLLDNFQRRPTQAPTNESWFDVSQLYPSGSRSPPSATSSMPSWADARKSPNLSVTFSNASHHSSDAWADFPSVENTPDPMFPLPEFRSHVEVDAEENYILFPPEAFGLGIDQGQHLDSYWKHFHPSFPIIHKPSFDVHDVRTVTCTPLLKAAMMGIGAQYSMDSDAKGDSRILHQMCLKLLEKRSQEILPPPRLQDMQAIFLIELLSLFRGQRASAKLSKHFTAMYCHLSQDHEAADESILEELANVPQDINEDVLRESWKRWIHASSKLRLLLASAILEAQHAMLIPTITPRPTIYQTNLPLPCSALVWNAKSASQWRILCRKSSPTGYILDFFSDLSETELFDSFQSCLFIANFCNLITPSGVNSSVDVAQYLDPTPSTQLYYHATRLAQETPLHALLAVSGESWILSEKVDQAPFVDYKRELRAWVDEGFCLRTPRVKQAVHHALQLIRIATEPGNENAGALSVELGIYYATLVLWAVTYAASLRRNQLQNLDPALALPALDSRPVPSTSAIPATAPTTAADTSATAAAHSAHVALPASHSSVLSFLHAAQLNPDVLISSSARSTCWDQQQAAPLALSQWQKGVVAVLRWARERIRGDNWSAMGEMLLGAVTVLDRVEQTGWTPPGAEEWF